MIKIMNPDSVSAQVPDIADGVSESPKASTTEVQTIISRKKTNAQKCREYRERKKLKNTMVQNITAERSDECSETDQLQAKKPKTNAERRKKHYEAQKLKKQESKKIPKTVKQKNKEYYERKKKILALNTLNHHSDVFSLETKARMHFLSNFDPETSERERRKLNRKSYYIRKYKTTKSLYNERGQMSTTGKDICDCLDTTCPGCHFPCPKCSSLKCGHECRVNRKWMYDKIEIEGNDFVVRNDYNKK